MTCLATVALLLLVSGFSLSGTLGIKKWQKTGICRDLRGDCATFRNWNWCTTRLSTMKRICRMSCGLCGEKKCKDLRSDCHYLSSLGWCKSQKRSMKQICPVTCKLCPQKESLIPTTRRPTTAESTTPKTAPTTPRPTTPSITQRPTTPRSTTPTTTERATQPTTKKPRISKPTQRRRRCRDRRTDCPVFVRLGWCVRRKEGMKVFCAANCGFCTSVPKKTTKATLPITLATTMATTSTKQTTTRKPTTMKRTTVKETTTEKPTTRKMTTVKKTTIKRRVTEDYPGCQDSRTDCDYLRRIRFCSSRRSAMARMCPRTCGLCSNKAVRKLYQKRKSTTTTTRPTTVRYVTARRSALCVDKYGTPRCEYYRYLGWCDKDNNVAKNCFKTCKCSTHTLPSPCHLTPFGCCWDKRTPKRNRLGLGCPKCADDPRFIVLCDRFNAACQTPGGLGESVRRYCPRMCNFC